MLFMVMHKINAEIASGAPPRKDLVDDMGKLIGEAITQGKLHDGDGLREPAVRARVKSGKVIRGPFQGDNELVHAFLKLTVTTMSEAEQWATRYAETVGAAEVEVGPATEAWDIGMAPKPEGPVPLRVLLLHKADKATEAGQRPSAEVRTKLGALIEDMKRAGVFNAAESLQPSSKAARLKRAGGKNTWTDGPFAESKELISGYAILKADSQQEARDWAARYAQILGDCEVDVRAVYQD